MSNILTAARRSTRAFNNTNDEQRATFLTHFRALLVAGGMNADDAAMRDVNDVFDGMDTPSSAAANLLGRRYFPEGWQSGLSQRP